MAIKLKFLTIPLLLTAVSCSINQQVTPVSNIEAGEICVINNPDVRETFLASYRGALEAKGFQSRLLEQPASTTDCPLTSTYSANWRWDMALYMAFAEIKVYANGKQVGYALYDSLGGGGNMSKFISADEKVQELVGELFPDS